MKAGEIWENNDLVLTNEIGAHLAHFTVYKNFKRIVKVLDYRKQGFMICVIAVAALQSGDDIKTVQENLGHYSASFTLDVYGHVSKRMKRENAERMEHFIKGVSE